VGVETWINDTGLEHGSIFILPSGRYA